MFIIQVIHVWHSLYLLLFIYFFYVGWGWFVSISLPVLPQMLVLPKAIVLRLKKYSFSSAVYGWRQTKINTEIHAEKKENFETDLFKIKIEHFMGEINI